MVRRFAIIAAASMLLAVCVAAPASAQDAREAEAPAHISLVEGSATLERDGRLDESPANMPLLAGDRVRTRAGRVEILFADGSTLHLDHNSGIDLQSDELLRLLDGRLRLSIPARTRNVSYRIDGPHAWAQISEPGEYRAVVIQNSGQSEFEFAVLRGIAILTNEEGQTTLRAGERAFARANAAPSHAYVVNSASWDAFDRWSDARRTERFGVSTEYLPDEVQPYSATLDRHGAWQYESSYGYVWYPRVDHGWRPYYHGRWSVLRPYGWTWIGLDPWAWPTHHYGRWGFSSAGLWFWIPGRSWSPAWVSWGHAPGYVSWCPLGFNNRAVFPFGNFHRGFDPWRGWTIVPHRQFGAGFVHRNVVSSTAIPAAVRSSFASRDSGPAITGYAVPRGSATAPIRFAGTPGSRRGTSPVVTSVAPGVEAYSSTISPTPSRSSTRAVDITRRNGMRPGLDNPQTAGRQGASAGVTRRAVPDRPMIRSERPERGADAVGPYGSARSRRYEPATRPSETMREPAVRRAYPRSEYGYPASASPGVPRRDRPTSATPGAYDRRPPTMSRPSAPSGPPPSAPPASARPGPSGSSPSAAPPSGSRSRPSGQAPSRGSAARRR